MKHCWSREKGGEKKGTGLSLTADTRRMARTKKLGGWKAAKHKKAQGSKFSAESSEIGPKAKEDGRRNEWFRAQNSLRRAWGRKSRRIGSW